MLPKYLQFINQTIFVVVSSLIALATMVCACTPDKTSTVNVMPLGDSITQANGDHDSFRRALWFKIQDAGYTVDFVGSLSTHVRSSTPPNPDFDLDHEGHWGKRADELATSLPTWLTLNVPDIVLLHVGTNDLGQGQSIATTLSDIAEIIDTLRDSNSNVVVLLAQIIPRLNATDIELFNSQLTGFASSKDSPQSPVIIVDQFTGFDAAVDTYDGVHPNVQGEEKIAVRWFSALQAVLNTSPSQQPTAQDQQ